jgi:hypothetical protein
MPGRIARCCSGSASRSAARARRAGRRRETQTRPAPAPRRRGTRCPRACCAREGLRRRGGASGRAAAPRGAAPRRGRRSSRSADEARRVDGGGKREALVAVAQRRRRRRSCRRGAQTARGPRGLLGRAKHGRRGAQPRPAGGVWAPQVAHCTMAALTSSVGAGVPAGGIVPVMSRAAMRSTRREPTTPEEVGVVVEQREGRAVLGRRAVTGAALPLRHGPGWRCPTARDRVRTLPRPHRPSRRRPSQRRPRHRLASCCCRRTPSSSTRPPRRPRPTHAYGSSFQGR